MHRLNWKCWTLGTKLTLLMTLLIIVTVASVTLLSIHREQQSLQKEQEHQAELMLDTLSTAAVNYLSPPNSDLLSDIAERLSQSPTIVFIHFYDLTARAIDATYDQALLQSLESDPFGQRLLESKAIVFDRQPDRLVVGRAVVAENQRVGAVSLGLSTKPLQDKCAAIRNQGLTTALVVATLGILLALLLNRIITAPLQELVEVTSRITAGDLKQQVDVRGSIELTTLASVFNSMTAQTRSLMDTIRQRVRELLVLQAAGMTITSNLELQHVLETVAQEMAHLVKAKACAISEWNQATDSISLLFEHGSDNWRNNGKREKALPLAGYPLIKRVLVERRAHQMTINQPKIDPAELAYMQATGIKTLVMLPMVYQGSSVGLAELMNPTERPLTDQEIELTQLLANQAASAIENARLYGEAQHEIAERIRMEEKLNVSLREKEVLLKEIHHRVKNNLQIIYGLLQLQSVHTQDTQVIGALKESQNRIRSMAAIHEILYQSQNLARVDFAEYIQKLTDHLLRTYSRDPQDIALKIDVASEIALSVDEAIPCGLIINELVSNSLKYAFPSGQPGKISISLYSKDDNRLTLSVSDNGVGLPPNVESCKAETLGLQLVTMLTEQLEGTIELDRARGTTFKIIFRQ